MRPTLAQFCVGLLFGVGLIVSGMSNPAKVLSFLDVVAIADGRWDASLAFVMTGAVGVAFVGFRLVRLWPAPLLGDRFHLPARRDIDARLLVGAALFGVGWGAAGLCPGPALTAIGAGEWRAWLFVGAMIVGMSAARLLARWTARVTA